MAEVKNKISHEDFMAALSRCDLLPEEIDRIEETILELEKGSGFLSRDEWLELNSTAVFREIFSDESGTGTAPALAQLQNSVRNLFAPAQKSEKNNSSGTTKSLSLFPDLSMLSFTEIHALSESFINSLHDDNFSLDNRLYYGDINARLLSKAGYDPEAAAIYEALDQIDGSGQNFAERAKILFDAEIARGRATTGQKVLVDYAQAALARWQETGRLDMDLGEFFVFANINDALQKAEFSAETAATELKKLRALWEECKEDARLVSQANAQAPDEDKFIETMRLVFFRLGKYYVCDEARFASILSGQGGNCEARTQLMAALMQASQHILPPHLRFGVQIFSDHMEPVIYNETNKTLWMLVNKKDGSNFTKDIVAPVFDPAILLHGYLKGHGAASPVTEKEMLIIAAKSNSKKSASAQRHFSYSTNTGFDYGVGANIAFNMGPVPERGIDYHEASSSGANKSSQNSNNTHILHIFILNDYSELLEDHKQFLNQYSRSIKIYSRDINENDTQIFIPDQKEREYFQALSSENEREAFVKSLMHQQALNFLDSDFFKDWTAALGTSRFLKDPRLPYEALHWIDNLIPLYQQHPRAILARKKLQEMLENPATWILQAYKEGALGYWKLLLFDNFVGASDSQKNIFKDRVRQYLLVLEPDRIVCQNYPESNNLLQVIPVTQMPEDYKFPENLDLSKYEGATLAKAKPAAGQPVITAREWVDIFTTIFGSLPSNPELDAKFERLKRETALEIPNP